MNDEQLKAALDRLTPPVAENHSWEDVQRRATRLRRRRRRTLLGGGAAVCAALFSTLAAAGQIGPFVSHSKGPHLLVRGTLYRADGGRAGVIQVELQRSTVAFGRRVRLMRWRTPHDGHRVAARWFLEVDGVDGRKLATGSLVVRPAFANAGRTIATLCAPCRDHDSGKIDLSLAQASALVNDEAAFVVASDDHGSLSGAVALDRSYLRRGVMCTKFGASCTRIYTGRS